MPLIFGEMELGGHQVGYVGAVDEKRCNCPSVPVNVFGLQLERCGSIDQIGQCLLGEQSAMALVLGKGREDLRGIVASKTVGETAGADGVTIDDLNILRAGIKTL